MNRSPKGNQPCVVRPENVMTFERAPEVSQLLDLFFERSLLGGEEDRVDGARRDAGDDFESQMRKMFGDASKEADLIGRAITALEASGAPGRDLDVLRELKKKKDDSLA